MKKLFSKLLALAMLIAGFGAMVSVPAYAGDDPFCDNPNLSQEQRKRMGCESGDEKALENTVQEIINRVILGLDIVAVIFIVLGGIGYMTSAGDAAKLKKAKDTILYAVIGLIICVLAYAITNFTISLLGD